MVNKAHLQELIEEATMDCYDEEEAFSGFWSMLDQGLIFPFHATILGEPLNVTGLSGRSALRRGLLAEIEKDGQTYTFPLSEMDVATLEGDAAAWIAAYQL